ncbi:hypothetical protein BDZ94DRAFT_615966 [Collybia nuda]|uniref:C2H2-type domain-containing protein n=1 Tax=Collybia nuda TaxID=64659 RepID=A0A9P6C7Z3_9AGAR|nr:hypothetical protein BDZ94DRAFT_615966 [Collybia nuda]
MPFACTLPCKSSFSSRGGLTRHQNVCQTFQTAQELRLEQRQATSAQIRQS